MAKEKFTICSIKQSDIPSEIFETPAELKIKGTHQDFLEFVKLSNSDIAIENVKFITPPFKL